jgi:diketogulonate reductase-like aldo/keto reductase
VNASTEAVDVIDVPVIDTWRAMEVLVKKGKVRSIGVSNFTKEKIEDLWGQAEIKPAVNQIEAHPYLQQPELLEWSKQKVCAPALHSTCFRVRLVTVNELTSSDRES